MPVSIVYPEGEEYYSHTQLAPIVQRAGVFYGVAYRIVDLLHELLHGVIKSAAEREYKFCPLDIGTIYNLSLGDTITKILEGIYKKATAD